MERAWVEYEISPLLTVRAGQFLTPYGIWVTDHGSPVLLAIRRPHLIRSQIFPERQTGLELHGRRVIGGLTAGYHLTLSNGRGQFDATIDADDDKAIGGRVFLQRYGGWSAAVGLSAYRGTATEERSRWVPDGEIARRHRTIVSQADELALGLDLRVEARHLVTNTELVLQERAYRDGRRPLDSLADPADKVYLPDYRRWGTYTLIGVPLAPWPVTPYTGVEWLRTGDGSASYLGRIPNNLVLYLGVNVKITPALVAKLEYTHGTFPGAAADSYGAYDWRLLYAQVAWAF